MSRDEPCEKAKKPRKPRAPKTWQQCQNRVARDALERAPQEAKKIIDIETEDWDVPISDAERMFAERCFEEGFHRGVWFALQSAKAMSDRAAVLAISKVPPYPTESDSEPPKRKGGSR